MTNPTENLKSFFSKTDFLDGLASTLGSIGPADEIVDALLDMILPQPPADKDAREKSKAAHPSAWKAPVDVKEEEKVSTISEAFRVLRLAEEIAVENGDAASLLSIARLYGSLDNSGKMDHVVDK